MRSASLASGVLAALSIAAAPGVGVGQEGPPADAGLELIVVTAQKREENAQDVPISIAALNANTLGSKSLSNISEIDELLPNIEFDSTSPFSGSNSVLSPFIRGIGQNDFAFNLEPGVGVYVDGVYYARTIGAAVDLLDLERVEVLKGPQGTLFGRNTIGGAISVITRAPSTEFDYRAQVTVGRFDRLDVRGSIDVPLIGERLYSQFSFSSKRRDGYQKRKRFPGAPVLSDQLFFNRAAFKERDTAGGESQDAFRGKLEWAASDSATFTLSGDYSTSDEEGTPATLLDTNAVDLLNPDADDLANPRMGLQASGAPTLATLYNTCIGNTPDALAAAGLGEVCGSRDFFRGSMRVQGPGLAGANTDGDPSNDRLPYGNGFRSDKDVSFSTGSNFSKVVSTGLSLNGVWSLSPTLELRSISAMRRIGARFGIDLDGSPIGIADTSFNTNQKQYSQEFQLTGQPLDGRLSWVAGLYYFHERGRLTDFVPFAEGTVQVLGENQFTNESFAGFANLNYQWTDALGVTVGARYTDEVKKFEGRQRDENDFPFKARDLTPDADDGMVGLDLEDFPACANGRRPCDTRRIYPIGNQHKDFQDLSVRLALDYRLADDVLTYASFSQGVKSGGFTTRLLIPEPNPNVAPEFDEETADSYEIGLKSRFFGNRLQLNAAAFYTRYDDIQVTVQRGVSPTFENAGQGVIRGVELEFDALVTDAWGLRGGVGVLDAEYRKLDPGTVLERGDRFVNTPDFSFNVTSSYGLPLDRIGAELGWELSYSHKSNVANDAENNPLFNEGHVNVVNTSFSYTPYEGNWQVTLGVRNLTDTRYVVSGFENPGVGFTSAIFSRPREGYLTVTLRR